VLKRFAAEHDSGLWKQNSKVAPATGKRVATVGSGPAGLTAAYYLAKLGHSVTIFEALPEPGGMMRVGIPDYRLPKDILKVEIEEIESIGVDIKTNTKVDSVEGLFEQGYNAIFLAVGAHQGIRMDIEGEDNPGVMECISFLRDVNLGKKVELGDRVAVIGGGNAAIDSARTALRLGAKEVTIVYRRSRDEMPASSEEIEGALTEGVNIHFLAAPSRIISQNGEMQLECIRMKLGAADASGRRRPEPVEGSEFSLNFDNIIAATGQRPEIPAQFGLPAGQGNTIQVDRNTLATKVEAVFAGGDSVTGPASVIEAIAAGRQAAVSIDKYLGGDGIIDEVLVDAEEPDPWLGQDDGFADRPGSQIPCLPVDERLRDFVEVELGFDKETAVAEAERCLRCDLRLHMSSPLLPPKEESWLEFNSANVSPVPEVEGVYQLLDEQKDVIYIAGTMNLRQGLEEHLGTTEAPLNKACYFLYEENPMYTVKESELIQQFSQQHGQMPEGNRDLDDLF
jgi:NADPH-dependent glutamate synthase beta subunit-like oxidoreductase